MILLSASTLTEVAEFLFVLANNYEGEKRKLLITAAQAVVEASEHGNKLWQWKGKKEK